LIRPTRRLGYTAAQLAQLAAECNFGVNPAGGCNQPTLTQVAQFAAAQQLPASGSSSPAPAAPPPASMPSTTAAASAGLSYTADVETAASALAAYGDTWDSAQSIVGSLYAAGVAPGTVTPAQAAGYMTGLSTTAVMATTPAFSFSEIPWYGWALGAAALLFVVRK